MSINQLQLTPELIAALYKKGLVSSKEQKKKEVEKTDSADLQSTVKYLGKHKNKILVLVNEHQAVFLQDAQLTYLTKILNACQRTVEDIALVNLASTPNQNYRTLLQALPSILVLLFGVTPTQLQLPIDFPQYQLQKLEHTTFLQAPLLQAVESSKTDREKLWQSLKKYFDV